MINSSNNYIIQSLWIGDTFSNIELLTLYSFLSHGHIFHLYTYNPITNKLPEEVILKDANLIIPSSQIFSYKKTNQFGHGKGSLGGFSDIFRYKLLYEQGGWWVDMDVTCLKPFNFEEDYIFRTHQTLKVVGNIMKCPPKSNLMKLCFEQAESSIDENNCDWHKPIQILNNNIEKLNLNKFIKDISNPDSWKIVRKLIVSKQKKQENWYAIHWVNEEWRRNKIDKNFYKNNTTLGELMLHYKISNTQKSRYSVIIQTIRLTFLYAAFKQLPSFIRFNLGIK